MSVDESLLCSFQVNSWMCRISKYITNNEVKQILKPAEKKQKYVWSNTDATTILTSLSNKINNKLLTSLLVGSHDHSFYLHNVAVEFATYLIFRKVPKKL